MISQEPFRGKFKHFFIISTATALLSHARVGCERVRREMLPQDEGSVNREPTTSWRISTWEFTYATKNKQVKDLSLIGRKLSTVIIFDSDLIS